MSCAGHQARAGGLTGRANSKIFLRFFQAFNGDFDRSVTAARARTATLSHR